MVLRGSETSPDERSFNNIASDLRKAMEALENAELQLTGKPMAVPIEEAVGKGSSSKWMKTEEFNYHLKQLNDRLELLDTKMKAEYKVKQLESDKLRHVRQLMCGSMAGLLSRTMVAPLDRVKILLQTQAVAAGMNANMYEGVQGTIRKIIKEEGPEMLWRGNGTNCLRLLPYAALQFWFYDQYKGYINRNVKEFGWWERLKAGAFAGMSSASVTYPLDLIRIRLATNTDPAVAGLVSQGRSIIIEGGSLLALYRGFIPTLTSLAPFIAINFATFDTMKTHLMPESPNSEFQRAMYVLFFGASSALVSQTICYPMDTVRRRMQVKGGGIYKSMVHTYTRIIRLEGFLALYNGLLPNLIKIVPNNAIRWLAYTYLCRLLNVEQRKKLVPESAEPTVIS